MVGSDEDGTIGRMMAELKDAVFPCVQCGYCCTKAVCSYGFWSFEKKQCGELTADNKCSRYDELVELEKDAKYPVMGWGCTSPLFNERRSAKLQANPGLITAMEIRRMFIEMALNGSPVAIVVASPNKEIQ